MDQRVEDFASKLSGAQSDACIWSAAEHFFSDFGFEGIMHGARWGHGTDKKQTIRIKSRPDWRAAYLSAGDEERDPLFAYTPMVPDQFFTGAEFLADHPYLTDQDIAVIRRAQDFGLISGVAIKMPQLRPGTHSGWNLISAFQRDDLVKQHQAHAGLWSICATLAHHEMHRFGKDVPESDPPYLSPREAECLLWLSQGLRTEQIADRMGIRPVTVDLHFRNARTRLNARTREQALAIALMNDLISP